LALCFRRNFDCCRYLIGSWLIYLSTTRDLGHRMPMAPGHRFGDSRPPIPATRPPIPSTPATPATRLAVTARQRRRRRRDATREDAARAASCRARRSWDTWMVVTKRRSLDVDGRKGACRSSAGSERPEARTLGYR
jgi:hypothetical protein